MSNSGDFGDPEHPRPLAPLIKIAELSPDAQLVAELTRLLEQANAGTLRGLAYVSIDAASLNQYGVVGAEARQNIPRTHFLLHWLAALILESWMKQGRYDNR